MPKAKSTYPEAPPDRELLSLPEAARELDVSYNTAAKMIANGEIFATKNKRNQWKIPRSEIDRYFREIRTQVELARMRGAE